jgi:very-long-chain ceramide synthase
MFGVFMISWLVSRHIVYVIVCWSVYKDTPRLIGSKCYFGNNANLQGPFETPPGYGYLLQPFVVSDGLICYNDTVKWLFLAPLLCLEVLTIVWFTMIVRVAVRVVRGDGADDMRSDDEADGEEEEEEEEDEFIYEEAQPLEEEVGVEALDLKGWERRTGVKRAASSSGVSLPGHSDRKELLGRIGCEKQVD